RRMPSQTGTGLGEGATAPMRGGGGAFDGGPLGLAAADAPSVTGVGGGVVAAATAARGPSRVGRVPWGGAPAAPERRRGRGSASGAEPGPAPILPLSTPRQQARGHRLSDRCGGRGRARPVLSASLIFAGSMLATRSPWSVSPEAPRGRRPSRATLVGEAHR